jgi:subtilisin family serine protease
MIFVGSATEAGDAFPANISGVIGVGNSDGNHTGATLAAPATHVMTLLPGNEYDFESGTSVAAAEVTGVVALLLSANSRLTGDSIVSLLKTTPGSQAQSLSIDVGAALAKVQAEKAGRLASREAAH